MVAPTTASPTATEEEQSQNFDTASQFIPITQKRPIANIPPSVIPLAGQARLNIAPDIDHPDGTKWPYQSGRHQFRSVLQQHVDFFDVEHKGWISMYDTYVGFRSLGFNLVFSLLAVFVINPPFSMATSLSRAKASGAYGWFWFFQFDPFMRVFTDNIHSAKHGSDTGTFDTEGRYIPQKFEEIFSKWSKEPDERLSLGDLWAMTDGYFVVNDFFGWFAGKFEWVTLWLLCRDADGMVCREDVRGCFDGSLFYRVKDREQAKRRAMASEKKAM